MSPVVRRVRFELPASVDPVFIRGEPEESYLNVALSLLLPHLEPYLIHTMREAKPLVRDAELARDLDAFCGQEGRHYRAHAELNAAFVRGGARGFDALVKELAEDYARFRAQEPLRFNLAYAEGFEALTTTMALLFDELDRSGWDPVVTDLLYWHLAEELEHRTVAFDVYQHVVGSYFYRVRVALYAQWHLLRFLNRAMEAMLAADPRTRSEFGGVEGRKRREPRLQALLTRKVLPRALRSHSPSYSPRRLSMPASFGALLEGYTARAAPR